MIELLASADDVVAVKVSGRIVGPELDAVMDRLDRVMADHDIAHVFAEVHDVTSIELAGLKAYAVRAMPLLRELHRFGRVAVVADQAWIRVATRLESALLPSIRYRLFEPAARDEAFSWVGGAGTGNPTPRPGAL